MDPYSREAVHQKINEIINRPVEYIYMWEAISELADLRKSAQDNSDTEAVQELDWEYDLLLYPVLGSKVQYGGKEVSPIANKWEYYLERTDKFTHPFSNLPFCQWRKEAVDYYRRRFIETTNNFAKARYSFALMTLSSGKDKFVFAKESYECWLNTAEEYVSNDGDNGSYEIVPLAYGLALRISLEFGQMQWAMTAFSSLSESITKTIDYGWRGWTLDILRLFVKHVGTLEGPRENKERIGTMKSKLISQLRDLIEKSPADDDYQLVRCYIEVLVVLVDEDEAYILMKRAAETHITQGDGAQEGLARYSFYGWSLKAYKEIQDRFPRGRDDTQARIDFITKIMKEQIEKIEWEDISVSFTVDDPVKNYIAELKGLEHGVLDKILDDRHGLIDFEKAKVMAFEQKEAAPLSFIFPVSVHNEESTVREHRSEDSLLDYSARRNIVMSIKFFEILFVNVMREMQDKIVADGDIDRLLSEPSISDIKPTLEIGFKAMLKTPPDHLIAAHMLTPYIEEIIRRIIVANGMEDRVVEWERQMGSDEKTISFRKIELGGLLGNDEVRTLLGSEFTDSLKTFLVEQDQINYRNRLLHGLTPAEKLDVGDTYFLTYSSLKLIRILGQAHTPTGLESKSN